MGTDMWAMVGRVKPNACDKEASTELEVFGKKKVLFEDLEFYQGDETNLGRSYKLYSFLGDNPYWPNPYEENDSYIENLAERQAATQAFIDWLNEQYDKSPVQFKNADGNYGPFIGDYISTCLYFVGDRAYTLHRIEDLGKFDYDQQNPEENKTYRELFPDWWFEFLKWCETNDWQFAIFGFSY